jgi:hypothetical protein
MEAPGEGQRLSHLRGRRAARIGASLVLYVVVMLGVGAVPDALAHQSGCHRWHSCPSDRGTYACGDLGYCSQCPDNQYCVNQKPRPQKAPPTPLSPAPTPPPRSPSQQPSTQSDGGAY